MLKTDSISACRISMNMGYKFSPDTQRTAAIFKEPEMLMPILVINDFLMGLISLGVVTVEDEHLRMRHLRMAI